MTGYFSLVKSITIKVIAKLTKSLIVKNFKYQSLHSLCLPTPNLKLLSINKFF